MALVLGLFLIGGLLDDDGGDGAIGTGMCLEDVLETGVGGGDELPADVVALGEMLTNIVGILDGLDDVVGLSGSAEDDDAPELLACGQRGKLDELVVEVATLEHGWGDMAEVLDWDILYQ